MVSKSEQTQLDILESACQEFVSVGYYDASMRTIAANASVTTGAIYRYYKDKDALFCAVTKRALEMFNEVYNRMTEKAIKDAADGVTYTRASPNKADKSNLHLMYDFMYEEFDKFYLLVCYSEETSLGSFVHQFVDLEVDTTVEYVEHLKRKYNSDYTVDKIALHSICEAFVTALFEPIRHRMSKEEALQNISFIEQFFIDGWLGVERMIIEDL